MQHDKTWKTFSLHSFFFFLQQQQQTSLHKHLFPFQTLWVMPKQTKGFILEDQSLTVWNYLNDYTGVQFTTYISCSLKINSFLYNSLYLCSRGDVQWKECSLPQRLIIKKNVKWRKSEVNLLCWCVSSLFLTLFHDPLN